MMSLLSYESQNSVLISVIRNSSSNKNVIVFFSKVLLNKSVSIDGKNKLIILKLLMKHDLTVI
jgi:hypothetical protein